MMDLTWIHCVAILFVIPVIIASTTPSEATTTTTAQVNGTGESTGSTTITTNATSTSLSTVSATTASTQTLLTTSSINCSYPGQECINGTCTSNGTCDCHTDFTGVRCETSLVCPDNYCFEMGTANCTVMDSGMLNCSCKDNYTGKKCEMYNGCMSSPCQNNGTCSSTSMYGDFHCDCTVGDQQQNCLLNEQDNCLIEPPNGGTFITCVDLIGSRSLYCSPGRNGSSCRDAITTDYCAIHGCSNTEYCNPLCNVAECNTTDVCRNFSSLVNLTSTLLYDYTECPIKFADGYSNPECELETGLFDGFDRLRTNLHDCSPFFNTTCTQRFSDGVCDSECNNSDCLFDGGDCNHPYMNSTGTLPGTTIIKLYMWSESMMRIQTKLSLFSRSLVHVSRHVSYLGLKIENSNFSDITIASKFFAAGIGKVPDLLKYVVDVYTCEFGKYGNGSDSVCDQNCSSTCKQTGDICHWGTGRCLHGCMDGYWGNQCQNMCPDICNGTCTQAEFGKYGNGSDSVCDQNCSSTCNQTGDICHWRTGRCLHGCMDGYWGNQCQNMCPDICNGTCTQAEGHCIICPEGRYGTVCQMNCDQHCQTSTCNIVTGECTCNTGRYWSVSDSQCMTCSKGCLNNVCSHGNGHCSCMTGYYGNSCMFMCNKNCKNGVCLPTGVCTGGCMSGYHGNMCDQSCAAGCLECDQSTGVCQKYDKQKQCKPGDKGCPEDKEAEESNIGVIIAIIVAVIIVLVIVLIAIICWRRKQSGDYILEDEERETLNNKTTTLEVKNDNLKPVSPYMGRSTDMIELDEKQEAGVYVGPDPGNNPDLVDRQPDGESMKSNKSSGSSDDENKSDKNDEEPATGVGAPKGRKRSSLKITLSREKPPDGEMSPKSPTVLVINDKTGEVLSPVTFDKAEKSAFEMPDTPLRITMAPLASEEDLLKDIGPKTTPEKDDNAPHDQPTDDPIINIEVNLEDDKERSRKSSSGSDGKHSKRSSSSSDGKKSDKSRSKSGSSSGSNSDTEDEKLAEYDENKVPLTEI